MACVGCPGRALASRLFGPEHMKLLEFLCHCEMVMKQMVEMDIALLRNNEISFLKPSFAV